MEQSSAGNSRNRDAIRVFLCVLALLLPFKFGSLVASGEQPNFPMDIWEWLFFVCYPSYLMPILSGLALLWVISTRPAPARGTDRVLPAIWLLPLLAGLVGLIRTSEWDFALQWFWHFLGAAALVSAVWWARASDDRLMPALGNAIASAGILCAVHGWRQHFGGLEEARLYAQKLAAKEGLELQSVIAAKMHQTRIYGSFVDPNVYASYLLVSAPIAIVALFRWAGHFEPKKLSRALFTGGGVVLFSAALVWSGSRGGAIGAIVGLAVMAWLLPPLKRWRWAMLMAGLVLLAAFLATLFFANIGRSAASASTRVEYYRVALQMFTRFPVTGAGLGEFFPWYMRLKPMGMEETRDPHNFLLSTLSQCGIAGGLAALACIGLPFALAMGWLRHHTETNPRPSFIAAIGGAAAWGTHSLFQFNDLVPASLYSAALLGLLALPADKGPDDSSTTARHRWHSACRCAAAVIALLALLGPAWRIPGEKLLQRAQRAIAKDPMAAISQFRSAAEKLPMAPAPARLLMDLGMQSALPDIALFGAEELVRRCPHRSSSHQRLAKVLLLLNRLDDAGAALALAQLWYPGDPELQVLRATLATLQRSPTMPIAERLALQQAAIHSQAWIKDNDDHIAVTVLVESPMPTLGSNTLCEILNRSTISYADQRPIRFAAITTP